MNYETGLEHFVEKIQRWHEGQTDSIGCPYWFHPYRVAISSRRTAYKLDLDIQLGAVFVVGLYHDVIEDTEATIEQVAEEIEDDSDVLGSIVLLTKPKVLLRKGVFESPVLKDEYKDIIQKIVDSKQTGSYEEYIDSLIEFSPDVLVPLVKYEDNCDNSLVWRSKKINGVNRKYKDSKRMLKAFIEESVYNDSTIE